MATESMTPPPPAAVPSRASARNRGGLSRWWRRRPVNRAQVLLHRWSALILGLFLVVETTSGAILLYHTEIFRATNGDLYTTTASADPISADRAIDVVAQAHPDFGAMWVAKDDGVWVVGNAEYSDLYFVDPGNGHINGVGNTDKGFMGLMVNIHDCGFGCEGYPGYTDWWSTPIWDDGPSFMTGITRGGFIVGVTGVLMLILVLSSFRIWWPGIKRLKSRFVVRTGRTRFARDYDLHNVIGAISLPFLLMWAITGAAFEFPVVEKAWLAITAGDQPKEEAFSIEPNEVPEGTPVIGLPAATDVALRAVPGSRAQWLGRPAEGIPYYEIDLVTGYGSTADRLIYGGDAYVLVDAHDASNYKVINSGQGDKASNRFYDKYLEPTHFGWNVNAWWRIIWFVLGIAPLALMLTGISTWLYRRGIKKRRRQAGKARLTDAQLDPDHLDRDDEADTAQLDPGDASEATLADGDTAVDDRGRVTPTVTS